MREGYVEFTYPSTLWAIAKTMWGVIIGLTIMGLVLTYGSRPSSLSWSVGVTMGLISMYFLLPLCVVITIIAWRRPKRLIMSYRLSSQEARIGEEVTLLLTFRAHGNFNSLVVRPSIDFGEVTSPEIAVGVMKSGEQRSDLVRCRSTMSGHYVIIC